MESRRGSGIFFGIVSVATLIVAIIGATFAYFSASISSDPNAVGATAYEFVNAVIEVRQVYPTKDSGANGLIPLIPDKAIEVDGIGEEKDTNLEYALNGATNKCVDDYGYQVCAVYEVTVTNGSKQSIDLTGKLKTTKNEASSRNNSTAFTNLTYQAVEVSQEGVYTLVGEAVPLAPIENQPIPVDSEINIAGLSVGPVTDQFDEDLGQTIQVNGTNKSYVLLYLNDPQDGEGGYQDQSGEMGASFEAQLIYTAGAGKGGQLTGTFTINGA